jgi:hypothetical protein
MSKPLSIYLGFDPREAAAFAVARDSITRRLLAPIKVRGLILAHLQAQGLYWRKHEQHDGQLWGAISNAPMATEFLNLPSLDSLSRLWPGPVGRCCLMRTCSSLAISLRYLQRQTIALR